MKLHYKGKFNGEETSLPQRKHPSNAVGLIKADNAKRIATIYNIISAVLSVLLLLYICLLFPYRLKHLSGNYSEVRYYNMILPCIALLPSQVIYGFLHAICFKRDVYLYTNLSKLRLIVVGTEDMSKCRYMFMTILPNFILGFVPFITSLLIPKWVGLGLFGACYIAAGAGDYANLLNVITQVPKNAYVYMSGMHTYWYKK